MSVNLLDSDQVGHRLDHPADLGTVLLDDDVANALQTEAAQRVTLVLLATDLGTGLGHLETHQAPALAASRPAAWARSMAAGATWSTGSPRRAATASGRSRPLRAATVAWTMLIALSEPSDFSARRGCRRTRAPHAPGRRR